MSSVKNVRLVWPEDLHRLVKAHAASEGVSLAGFVEACVRAGLREAGVVRPLGVASVVEGVSGVVEEGPLVPARVVGRRVVHAGQGPEVVAKGEVAPREVVESEWKPAPGLSKAEQAKRGRK